MQKKRFDYQTADGLKTLLLTIKLNSYCKLYFVTKDIPAELLETSTENFKKDRNEFSDFDSLCNFINRVIEDHEQTLIEEAKSKVILYMLSVEEHDDGQKVDLKYKNLTKVKAKRVGKEDEVSYYTERLLSGGTRKFGEHGTMKDTVLDRFNIYQFFGHVDEPLEMDWTAERELWFETMTGQLRELAQKLKTGFGTKALNLANKIDKSGLAYALLPAVSENR